MSRERQRLELLNIISQLHAQNVKKNNANFTWKYKKDKIHNPIIIKYWLDNYRVWFVKRYEWGRKFKTWNIGVLGNLQNCCGFGQFCKISSVPTKKSKNSQTTAVGNNHQWVSNPFQQTILFHVIFLLLRNHVPQEAIRGRWRSMAEARGLKFMGSQKNTWKATNSPKSYGDLFFTNQILLWMCNREWLAQLVSLFYFFTKYSLIF